MIESNILGAAAGIQYQGVIDKSEGTVLPALSNGVIIGRFKRGYTGKVFTVTANSYKTVLGHDPSNPSYMAVADLFSRGVSEVGVLRVGMSGIPKPSLDDYLLAGGAPIAMDKAVTDLIGEGVEWTADVEGGWVNYSPKSEYSGVGAYDDLAKYKVTLDKIRLNQALDNIRLEINKRSSSKYAKDFVSFDNLVLDASRIIVSYTTKWCTENCGVGTVYPEAAPDRKETEYLAIMGVFDGVVEAEGIPITTIAAQVRVNAAAGHAASQQAVADSAK